MYVCRTSENMQKEVNSVRNMLPLLDDLVFLRYTNICKVRTGAIDQKFSEEQVVVKEYGMMDSRLVAVFYNGCYSECLFEVYSVRSNFVCKSFLMLCLTWRFLGFFK